MRLRRRGVCRTFCLGYALVFLGQVEVRHASPSLQKQNSGLTLEKSHLLRKIICLLNMQRVE